MMGRIRFVSLHPVCQLMLTAAALVLTLDILRVINNEVAVPHHREIHRQLADFHPLVQILEATDGKREREVGGGGGECGNETKREEGFNGRFGILNSHDPL